jgi:glutathione synthase
MKIAFLTDPLSTFKIHKDSTYAMMVEATRRNYSLYVFEQKDMILENGVVTANVVSITLTESGDNWYSVSASSNICLSDFDVILIRKDPPFNMEYTYSMYLLELAEKQGARVFNRPRSIRDYNEKLAIFQFSEYISPTLVTRDKSCLHAFHEKHKDIILKPLDGMGGASIFRVQPDGLNLGSIIEFLTNNGRFTVMVQRFIPEISKGDKRILVIGGKIVPFSLARIPKYGEVRANLAVGGTGVAQPLTKRDQKIAEALAPILSRRGLLVVGLDVIGEYLTEINITSPTCFQEINQQVGFDVAKMFIDALEAVI